MVLGVGRCFQQEGHCVHMLVIKEHSGFENSDKFVAARGHGK